MLIWFSQYSVIEYGLFCVRAVCSAYQVHRIIPGILINLKFTLSKKTICFVFIPLSTVSIIILFFYQQFVTWKLFKVPKCGVGTRKHIAPALYVLQLFFKQTDQSREKFGFIQNYRQKVIQITLDVKVMYIR